MTRTSLDRSSSCLLSRGFGLVAAALLGAAGFATSAQAQCNQYIYNQTTGSIVPGTDDIGNHIDDGGTFVSLPFAFNFYGASYNGLTVSSNGYITFNGTDNAAVYNQSLYCLPYATFTGAIMGALLERRLHPRHGPGHLHEHDGVVPQSHFQHRMAQLLLPQRHRKRVL